MRSCHGHGHLFLYAYSFLALHNNSFSNVTNTPVHPLPSSATCDKANSTTALIVMRCPAWRPERTAEPWTFAVDFALPRFSVLCGIACTFSRLSCSHNARCGGTLKNGTAAMRCVPPWTSRAPTHPRPQFQTLPPLQALSAAKQGRNQWKGTRRIVLEQTEGGRGL